MLPPAPATQAIGIDEAKVEGSPLLAARVGERYGDANGPGVYGEWSFDVGIALLVGDGAVKDNVGCVGRGGESARWLLRAIRLVDHSRCGSGVRIDITALHLPTAVMRMSSNKRVVIPL